mgnify:CR=1 FL=1
MKKEFLGISILIFLFLTAIVTASTFTDNSQEDFESGEYNRTFYNSSGFVQLNSSRLNGTFISQIFNSGENSQWNNMSWFTEIPYNQELPNNQESETGDFLRGMNMTGNVLLMHMNEESGTIEDFSGNGNNGTYNGELYSQDGKLNTAIGFNGNNDYINIDSYSPHYVSGDSFTYSLWFKTSETTRGDLLDIRDTDLSGFPVNLITHNWQEEGKISFVARGRDGNLKTITHSNYAVNDDSWHLATATVNDGNGRFYIDGSRIGSFTGLDMDMDFSDSNLYLASTEGTDRLFNGVLDEVAIFNRSLSAQEIRLCV